MSQLILQPFRRFTYVIGSFYNLSVASPTSQLILQPFRRFTYVIGSFHNLSVALPTSQLILQLFRRFTYITAHSPTLPSLYLRHSSFYNPSVASTTLQLILQPFHRFTYVTGSFYNPSVASPTSQALHWRAADVHKLRWSYEKNTRWYWLCICKASPCWPDWSLQCVAISGTCLSFNWKTG